MQTCGNVAICEVTTRGQLRRYRRVDFAITCLFYLRMRRNNGQIYGKSLPGWHGCRFPQTMLQLHWDRWVTDNMRSIIAQKILFRESLIKRRYSIRLARKKFSCRLSTILVFLKCCRRKQTLMLSFVFTLLDNTRWQRIFWEPTPTVLQLLQTDNKQ